MFGHSPNLHRVDDRIAVVRGVAFVGLCPDTFGRKLNLPAPRPLKDHV